VADIYPQKQKGILPKPVKYERIAQLYSITLKTEQGEICQRGGGGVVDTGQL
jgi:hypothetical protein